MQRRYVPPAHRLARSVLALATAGSAAAIVFAVVTSGLADSVITFGEDFAAWARTAWETA